MEGIPVKISEKYKPPRKITLPASAQNKLNAELKLEKYDFELERFVADQMAKLKEEQKKLSEAIPPEDKTVNIQCDGSVTQSNILMPIPSKPLTQSTVSSHQIIGGINISDFENDTSSPFDSVELKTLNDMEELAHVLGGTRMSPQSVKWPLPQNGSSSWAWDSGYSPQTNYPLRLPPSQYPTGKVSVPKPVEKIDNETSTILKSLQLRIEERKVSACQSKLSEDFSSKTPIAAGVSNSQRPDKKREVLPNPLPSLNGQSQTVARRIAEMGFPISRAARATEMFGPNEGKVIEFMLEVQSLEEAGYPGERAERVLVLSKYSRDDAVKFLDSMSQIMRLGFSEEDVLSALIKAGFDRDKAVDSLIS